VSQGSGLLVLLLSLAYNAFVLKTCSKWGREAEKFTNEVDSTIARYDMLNKNMRKEDKEVLMNKVKRDEMDQFGVNNVPSFLVKCFGAS
jgi:lipid II:glycine glycyltransferase (peptidoglycan interpeptide bridge formation enzyme)